MIDYKINIDEAVRYMGYRGFTPGEQEKALILSCEKQLREYIEPAWVYRAFPTEQTDEGILLKGTTLTLTGEDIRSHLEGCGRCVLLCATAGAKADELIRLKEKEDLVQGYITDCLASAAVEGVCDSLEAELSKRLADKYLTWRFSPGYGDLPLDLQPKILAVLEAGKRAGVSCTGSLLMIPRKTVTAVIGISDTPIVRKKQGCAACSMKDRCTFRKAGEHCGS
ncbi:MAG: hypothetical protein K6C68_01850 [Ruminococcus sp.]|nr:hypothetical protein [Ruminococcus sp.]